MALLLLVQPHAAQAQDEEPLSEVAQLTRIHRNEEAIEAIDRLPESLRVSPAVRYLKGRLLARVGRVQEAAGLFLLPPGSLPERVHEDARYRRAVLSALVGDCGSALPALLRFGQGGDRRAAQARAQRAVCMRASGQVREALPILRAVAREDARGVDTFAVRLETAQALLELGQRDAAIAELRELLVQRPEHPDIAMVELGLRELGTSSELSVSARLDRAERFTDKALPNRALDELDLLSLTRASEHWGRYLHLRGMALYRTRRRYAEAARVLRHAARVGGATAMEDEFHAARALSRAHRNAPAVAAYRRFVRRHGGHALAPQAEYLAGWLELRMGRRVGERHLERFLDGARSRRSSSLRQKAAFQLGFSAFERRRHDRATLWLERYAAMSESWMVKGRGLYWAGRAHQEKGDRSRAIRAFRGAMSVEPLQWYGLLARQRLFELGEQPPPPFPDSPRDRLSELPSSALPPEVRFYHELGLDRDAASALRAQEAVIRSGASRGRGLEALVAAYHAVGHYERPQRLAYMRARDRLARDPHAHGAWAWSAMYPRPFPAEVGQAARASGVNAEHLWAIMWQESRFSPEAVSSVGAIGLMQLMPATAERVARGLGLEVTDDMLFAPSMNVRLGATYNATLLSEFEAGPLAIAAYNAGGHRVRRWLEQSGRVELDRFVERIPIDQTRNYVRRVVTHYARYHYLAQPEGSRFLELPTHVSP